MLWLWCKNLGSQSLHFTVASYFYCKTNRWLSTLLRQITAKGSTEVSTAFLKLYSSWLPEGCVICTSLIAVRSLCHIDISHYVRSLCNFSTLLGWQKVVSSWHLSWLPEGCAILTSIMTTARSLCHLGIFHGCQKAMSFCISHLFKKLLSIWHLSWLDGCAIITFVMTVLRMCHFDFSHGSQKVVSSLHLPWLS